MGSTIQNAIATFPLWAALSLAVGIMMIRWHKQRSERDGGDNE